MREKMEESRLVELHGAGCILPRYKTSWFSTHASLTTTTLTGALVPLSQNIHNTVVFSTVLRDMVEMQTEKIQLCRKYRHEKIEPVIVLVKSKQKKIIPHPEMQLLVQRTTI